MTSNELRFRATLSLDFKPIPPVWASEGKLSQVFLNLLINASHAMDDSETRAITVRTWTEDDRVCAAVEDTGAGIQPEHLARIFEPFFSTKQIGAGSGLGLSICRNIVDELGGEIRVESELGKGTRFIVRLPIWTEAAASRPQPPSAEAVGLQSSLGRVLIIDDEAPLRTVMQRMLVVHEVVSAASGKEALRILEHDRAFDLILCDLMMPDVSGIDVHHWLATRDPALASRLVFITGGAFGPVAAEYLSGTGNLKLEKPFTTNEFREVVYERIRASKSEPPTRLDIPIRRPGESS
ncbi:MAG TPA: ATP-binding protein, partial [Polyangiaceae bacterium]|jgi:CheY-like chemotaxis protein